jgi:prepilin-type N-terminal cleavage/methylation domain-containing protein
MKSIRLITDRNGFTLMELLIVLTIAAILTFQIVPSFARLIQSMRISAAASNMERTLRIARSAALLRRELIRICPSEDGYWCSNNNDWSTGWITYVDQTGEAIRNPEDIIIATQGPYKAIGIYYNRGGRVSVNALGRITQSGTIRICDRKYPDNSVNLVMIHSARLRRERGRESCT